MTDDLVKCLRNRANGIMQWVTVERIATEAADRIEVLEAALRWYAENCAANGDKIEGPSGDYGQRARAALAGEKD